MGKPVSLTAGLLTLVIFGAVGYPQIGLCMENGGGLISCALAGIFVGAIKTTFYLLGAILSGLYHLVSH